jgi:hypothetical protein
MGLSHGRYGVASLARVGCLVTAIVALSGPVVFAQVPSTVCGVPGSPSTVAHPAPSPGCSITFTYGVRFLQGLTLYAEAPSGLVNLTARITTIDLPAGATLTSGSDTAYPLTPSSPTAVLTSLVTFVQALNLSTGIANSLDAKLQNVLDALDAAHAGDLISACHRLDAFINEVAAQAGNKLTETQAAQLTLRAENVRVALGCG